MAFFATKCRAALLTMDRYYLPMYYRFRRIFGVSDDFFTVVGIAEGMSLGFMIGCILGL